MTLIDQVNSCAGVLLDVLGCDNVYVNIQSEQFFYSLGNLPEMERASLQTHNMHDTLCAITLATNEPLRLENAAADDAYKDTTYVKDGSIVAYLGVPIALKDYGPIGTVCVVSKTPRAWTDAEQKLVVRTAFCVEAVLELQLSEVASEQLSEVLSEHDQVLMLLAKTMSDAISIYDQDHNLVFASSALLDMVGYSEIDEAANLIDVSSLQHEGSLVGDTITRVRVGRFSVAIRQSNTNHFIFSWAAGDLS